jgi:tetratricopeptide (TPR) repeat protein
MSVWFHIRCVLLAIAVFTAIPLFSQPTSDSQLALYYYQSGEFDKAAMYYEKLYDNQPSDLNYEYLLGSYTELQDFKSAEKLIKKHIKGKQNDSRFMVDLGQLYSAMGDQAGSIEAYNDAIKNMGPHQREVVNLANAFIKRRLYDQALETYEKGKKLLKGAYPFNYEMASLYGTMGEFDRMVDEYLVLLDFSEAYLQTVQNALNRFIDFEEEPDKVEQLRIKLLKQVQRAPQNDTYAELLIWLYTQKKSFNSALIQVKALDKRKNEDGHRVVKLAQMAASNNDFKTAVKCYEYVIEKDPVSPYYTSARMNLVSTRKSELDQNPASSLSDYSELENLYLETLESLGWSANTAEMIREMALLQAFRLNKPDTAITVLNETLELGNLKPITRSEIKMSLADVMLATGDVWEASLLYSQVEKDHKHDIIGHEAKFRNARISYYTGDFEWAQAQLDVLKASTSKLISNDAMELSLLITDNFALDTVREPMERFARADLLLYQGKLEDAENALDSLSSDLSFHSLEDDILFKRYEIALERKKFDKARDLLSEIISLHGTDLLGDDAIYALARMEESVFDNPERAKELYRQLLTDHSGSLFVVEARKRFRALRGDFDDATLP